MEPTEFPVYSRKKKPAAKAPQGDVMDQYLTVKDQNMKLKRSKAENDQRLKEMGTKLAIVTQKLSQFQSKEGAGDDSGMDDAIARLHQQNRELQRKNAELAGRVAGSQKKARPASAVSRPTGGSKSGTRPKSVGRALKASPSGDWSPDRENVSGSGGGSGFDSKLRGIIQERDQQIRELSMERDQLHAQIKGETGAEGGIKELQHQVASKQAKLDLIESKYEQLDASFKALRSNHEKALAEVDALNKELIEERRSSVTNKHDKKVLEMTQESLKTQEEEVQRLRKLREAAEERANDLMNTAMSGKATKEYKDQIAEAKRRIQELQRANGEMEESVQTYAEEAERAKDRVANMEKSHGSYQGEKKRYESNVSELEMSNKQLMEKLSIFTGDTGIDIDDLEKALAIVKRGEVQGMATSGPARGLDGNQESLDTLKREQASLVEELNKVQKMLSLQDDINKDYKSELDAQKVKFGQMRKEYDYKLQEANRTLLARAERIRILETRLRNQIYSMSRTQQGALRNSMTPRGDDDAASVVSDTAFDDDVADGENVFEVTIRELLLDPTVSDEFGVPPATFFTFDFFEFETQTTPVVSGSKQQLDYTSQFVVKVDAFFLNYLATKTMKLDLFQSLGGMDFQELATCQVSFRKLLDTLAGAASVAAAPPHVEISADMVNITGGGGQNKPLVRTVIGTVTYRMRFRQSATQAIQLLQERLAAHVNRSPMAVTTGTEDSAGPTETRELCVLVSSVTDVKPQVEGSSPKPYVHYQLLDFPDHFTRSGDGFSSDFKDLECYRLEVGGDDSPIARWLSTGAVEFAVFDDADEDPEFFLGTAKVALGEMTSYPCGKIMATDVAVTDSKKEVRGRISVEIFWSHSVKDSDRESERAAAVAAAAKSKKRPPTKAVDSTISDVGGAELMGIPKEVDADTDVEELLPVDPTGAMVSGSVNLNLKNARSKGTGRYSEAAEPAAEPLDAADATDAGAKAENASDDGPGGGPNIEICVHKIICTEDTVSNEMYKSLYVAVEWLQDEEDIRKSVDLTNVLKQYHTSNTSNELETPSMQKAETIAYASENTSVTPDSVYGLEIKRKLAEGKVQVDFALVNDPGGDDPECEDIGTASVDLTTDLLDKDVDMIEATLAVMDESGTKKIADVVVTIKALDALKALA